MTVDPFAEARGLAPWGEVRARLATFDATAFGAALAARLAEPAEATAEALGAWVVEQLGDHHGHVVFNALWGDLQVGHGALHAYVPPEDVRRLRAANGGLEAARAEAEWLRRLAAIFDAVDGTEASVDDAVDAILDGVMERTGLDDAWYQELDEPLLWLADHLGRPRAGVDGLIEARLYRVVFSSWTAPSNRSYGVRVLSDALTGSTRAVPPALIERAARILRPPGERLAEARAAAEGVDPQEALESLIARGLLDPAWADDDARCLGTAAASNARIPRGTWARLLVVDAARPGARAADLPLLVRLASGEPRVLRAESLARELVQRLHPFGLEVAVRAVAWASLPRDATDHGLWPVDTATDAALRRALLVVNEAMATLQAAGKQRVALRRHADRAAHGVASVQGRRDLTEMERDYVSSAWEAADAWAVLATANARLPLAAGPRGEHPRARDVPSPFDALVALWDLGYGVLGVDGAAGVVVVYAGG